MNDKGDFHSYERLTKGGPFLCQNSGNGWSERYFPEANEPVALRRHRNDHLSVARA